MNVKEAERKLLLELRDADDRGVFGVACDGKERRATAHALDEKGYARWRGENWGSSFWSITTEGREAANA